MLRSRGLGNDLLGGMLIWMIVGFLGHSEGRFWNGMGWVGLSKNLCWYRKLLRDVYYTCTYTAPHHS